MQSPGDELFTGSGGPGYQNSSEVGGNPSNLRIDFQHKRAAPNHALELIGIDEFLIQAQGLSPQLGLCRQRGDSRPEFVNLNRLRQIVRSTLLNRFQQPIPVNSVQ